ncbi:hypothetical protein A4G19_06870 [Pasteurellaceae bacterium Macca]|nr:hypothetical protein [Pasteurellaceae bacterium Macca]
MNQQSGIQGEISGQINDLNLKGGYLVNQGRPESLKVKGKVESSTLEDSHHKDGGSVGGSIGFNQQGLSAFNIRGGRSAQTHYEATQKSTLSGVKPEGDIKGPINDDLNKSKEIKRNDNYASTQFNFEGADLAQLAKKAVDKVRELNAKENATPEKAPSEEPIYAKVDKSPEALAKVKARSDEAAAKLPPKSTAHEVDDGVAPPLPPRLETDNAVGRSATRHQSDALPALPKVGKSNASEESDYAEIPAITNRKAKVESDYAEIPAVTNRKAKVESDYAEIPAVTNRKPQIESDYAEIPATTEKAKIAPKAEQGKQGEEPIYAKVDKSPEALARAKARSDEAAAKLPPKPTAHEADDEVAPPLPPRQETESAVGRSATRHQNDALPALPKVGKSNASEESDYAEIPAVTNRKAKVESDYAEIPAVTNRKAKVESDYAEIPAVTNRKAKVESDYAEIPAVTNRKPQVESDYAEIPATTEKAKVAPKAEQGKQGEEPIYAKVDKSPEALAKANKRSDEAVAKLPPKPTAHEADDEVAPPLPPRGEHAESSQPSGKKVPPAVPPKPKVKIENGIVRLDTSASNRPSTEGKEKVESDYAEIPAVTNRKPQVESDYAEIPATTEKAKVAPKAEQGKQGEEPIYAKVDKSPEALAKANARSDEAEAQQGGVKWNAPKAPEDDVPPALPPRPTQGEKGEDKGNTPVSDKVKALELVEQPRGVLQQAKDAFQPLRVKKKIDDVRQSAEEYGGEVTFKYAQSKGEVFKEIIKHIETEHGVCESTCAHWIASNANNESLWKSLYKDGDKNNKLDKEAFETVKQLQTAFIKSGSSATQQFKLTDSWLQEQGVVPKEKKIGDNRRRDEVAGTVTKDNIDGLVKAIVDTGSQDSAIKKISINLEGGSHTVSASVKGDKVVFFDPNFGEIAFKSKASFEKWMKNAFWQKSGYAGKKGGKRFFNVVNYEPKAKNATNEGQK